MFADVVEVVGLAGFADGRVAAVAAITGIGRGAEVSGILFVVGDNPWVSRLFVTYYNLH